MAFVPYAPLAQPPAGIEADAPGAGTLSIFSAAGGALLLGMCAESTFSVAA
jgi:hypothetical protein